MIDLSTIFGSTPVFAWGIALGMVISFALSGFVRLIVLIILIVILLGLVAVPALPTISVLGYSI